MDKPPRPKPPKLFNNLSPTPQFGEGYGMFDAIKTIFNRPKTLKPGAEIPSVKTDLKSYYSKSPSVIWFGHSSYLIHADGINILVDPVLSGHAAPFSFQFKAFNGADVYKVADMPNIDCLILTHNHYDHLDRGALKLLTEKTKAFVMPSQVSKSLKGLNIPKEKITELNWWESAELSPEIKITATPARHFSGRGLKRNGSLWSSYVLEIKGYKLFLGGDSGYDTHFKEIGDKFGPFDLALLECGQYNVLWPYIHSMPEELITEAQELKAKVVMPVHWGKFALSNHPWNEPAERFVTAAEEAGIAYTTPRIGEPVVLDENYPTERWWQ
ncbi:MAG: outer membrane protein RomA [Sphingobacteriaceae bacterium]|jgi:L-ascorbate metabolism protein UlaG (beta-lactamase superfamily)|nr:outer membrane protein RomA [Sphingobacteriaceae bacterium]